MKKDVAIKVENASKKYCKSLRKSMIYGLIDIARNSVGMSSHSHRLRKGEFWAVNDVSFEIKKGETLGLIGPNGSGKTTLLKMLNGIFWPDKGKISIRGRVGALIEVGAGFHPMLSGSENVYINGAILGMKKKEIDEKFDDIIEFADIGDFIDTPVKYYSSGMYVRLGFAVAAHCDANILLVDEVLAVGDSVFRNKCYQKMNELKRKDDVTIVFVSHNLLAVERFCDKGIFLNKGSIQSYGGIDEVIRDYQGVIAKILSEQKSVSPTMLGMPYSTKEAEIINVKYLGKNGKEQKEFFPNDTFGIRVEYKSNKRISNPIFQISLVNQEGTHIAVFGTHIDDFQIKSIQGDGAIECWIDNLPLLWNRYHLTVAIYDETHNITFDYWNGIMHNQYFQVLPDKTSEKMSDYTPICRLASKWKLE
ncbi:MAG: ABC transporter ATP-binding protein [Promethearchaeota archaeon]